MALLNFRKEPNLRMVILLKLMDGRDWTHHELLSDVLGYIPPQKAIDAIRKRNEGREKEFTTDLIRKDRLVEVIGGEPGEEVFRIAEEAIENQMAAEGGLSRLLSELGRELVAGKRFRLEWLPAGSNIQKETNRDYQMQSGGTGNAE